jgi:nicotinate phosphoribosyltransferase
MAAGYFHSGMKDTIATCEMFVRNLPLDRSYLLACGIEPALDYICSLGFEDREIEYLKSVPALKDAMTEEFIDYLKAFRFSGDVWAMDEGEVFFAKEPVIKVRAPIIEAQLLETFLLSTINHATMIASKASRIVQAAGNASVVEFGTRRTHPDAAVDAARAAYIAGFTGTSNLEAGLRYGIPVVGTAAHMWTMTHDSEEESFRNYAKVFPNSTTLLIDTYDTRRGAKRAIEAAKEKLKGVRLDSGHLISLSIAVRRILDEAGLHNAKIVASNDLNEYKIKKLVDWPAPIDIYGVGTELVTSKDSPSLGGVYKVVQFERDNKVTPVAKFSEGKVTHPGAHQVYRRYEDGIPVRDIIALENEPRTLEINGVALSDMTPLLKQRISGGWKLEKYTIDFLRKRAVDNVRALFLKTPKAADGYPHLIAAPSLGLHDLTSKVKKEYES